MESIETRDFFRSCPVHEFVGAGFHKYRPNWGWERNINNASLYFIADGCLKFAFTQKCFVAKKNDVVLLKKSDVATISNDTDEYSTLYYVAFNYDESVELGIDMVTVGTGHKNLFKDILDAHLSKASYSSLKILQLFLKLIYNLALDNLHSRKDYISVSKIHEAAEYININYYKDITINDLCKMTGYSEAHLRRLFIKNFGMSPQNYILDKRIEMAKEMLLDIPEKTVEEIADLLGISSTSYFCKLFKGKTGLSPSEYKKQNINEN